MRSVDQKEFLGGQGTVHFNHMNLEEEELQVMALIIYDHECQ